MNVRVTAKARAMWEQISIKAGLPLDEERWEKNRGYYEEHVKPIVERDEVEERRLAALERVKVFLAELSDLSEKHGVWLEAVTHHEDPKLYAYTSEVGARVNAEGHTYSLEEW